VAVTKRTSARRVSVPPAQQLDLGGRRDVTDLIEEQRPALGQLDLARLARGRSREGPLLVPVELALEERLGQRPALDLHEGAGAARGQLVDPAGHQLLARAGLAADEHGGLAGRRPRHQRQDGPQGPRVADQRAPARFTRRPGRLGGGGRRRRACALHHEEDVLHDQRLHHVVAGAGLDCLDGRRDRAAVRDQHQRHLGRALGQNAPEGVQGRTRQGQVHQGRHDHAIGEGRLEGRAAVHHRHAQPLLGEGLEQRRGRRLGRRQEQPGSQGEGRHGPILARVPPSRPCAR
jgi:hypothetical protein